MNDNPLNIGVIGTGYMGCTHARAFLALSGMHNYPRRPFLHTVASTTLEGASRAADIMNFAFHTDDWRQICSHPDIDIVSITSPPDLHYDMAVAAIKEGKAVYLEKPVTVDLEQLYMLNDLAQQHATCITIGYNYLHNPMIYTARDMIAAGELGELISLRAIHAEDFMTNADSPFKYWHPDPNLGGGVIKELASHPLAMVHSLLGDKLSEVSAATRQLHSTRYDQQGQAHQFHGEDHLDCLVRLDSGLQGTLTASWVATGKKMQLEWEIYGTKGSLSFTQERLNELKVYTSDSSGQYGSGFTTLRASAEHPCFSFLCPGDEHGIGFSDLKILEAKHFLDAYFDNGQPAINLSTGTIIHEQIEAIHQSAQIGSWQKVNYKYKN